MLDEDQKKRVGSPPERGQVFGVHLADDRLEEVGVGHLRLLKKGPPGRSEGEEYRPPVRGVPYPVQKATRFKAIDELGRRRGRDAEVGAQAAHPGRPLIGQFERQEVGNEEVEGGQHLPEELPEKTEGQAVVFEGAFGRDPRGFGGTNRTRGAGGLHGRFITEPYITVPLQSCVRHGFVNFVNINIYKCIQPVPFAMHETEAPTTGFSSRKRSILQYLKRNSNVSLANLARDLGISKVATLRHLGELEREGLVERSQVTHGVGRPSVHFRLRSRAQGLFPQAYADMSLAALTYVEEHLGRKAVGEVLAKRSQDVRARYWERFRGQDLVEKVKVLAQVREEGGYMADARPLGKEDFELCEYNCPILAIAGKYGEACESERKLFEGWLGTSVEVTHRVVAGAPVCRFRIRGVRAP